MNLVDDRYREELVKFLDHHPLATWPDELHPWVGRFYSLSLQPAMPCLTSVYPSLHKRGGFPPRCPAAFLRSWLLAAALATPSFRRFHLRLRREPLLAALAGWPPHAVPARSSFDSFVRRLALGPLHPNLQRRSNPSFGRVLFSSSPNPDLSTSPPSLGEADLPAVAAAARRAELLLHAPFPTDPPSLFQRLLHSLAVLPSADAGLLSDPRSLAADSSLLPSHAAPPVRLCGCSGSCSCETLCADADARFGYSSSKDSWVFGYKLHLLASIGKHDLPLALSLTPASAHDAVEGLHLWSRFLHLQTHVGASWPGRTLALDMGYDALPVYEWLHKHGISPVIPLRQSSKKNAQAAAKAEDGQGHPVCKGGLKMRYHGFYKDDQAQLYNCPVKRPARKGGKSHVATYLHECPLGVLCEPESSMGPWLTIPVSKNLRLTPPLPRHTERFREAYAARSGAERLNSHAKEAANAGRRPYRRIWKMWMYLTAWAIGRHLRVWALEGKLLPLPE